MNNSPNLILPTRKVLEDEKAWNEYFQHLTPEQQLQIAKAVEGLPRIGPLPGPQTLAYNSTADIIGFGRPRGRRQERVWDFEDPNPAYPLPGRALR